MTRAPSTRLHLIVLFGLLMFFAMSGVAKALPRVTSAEACEHYATAARIAAAFAKRDVPAEVIYPALQDIYTMGPNAVVITRVIVARATTDAAKNDPTAFGQGLYDSCIEKMGDLDGFLGQEA